MLGVAVALLAALPSAVAALPASEQGPDAVTLLARVRAGDSVAYQGYAEARGDLVLPEVDVLGGLPDLISGTTRLRAWWRGRDAFRVDALTLVGEVDVAVGAVGTWTWLSADRTATLVRGPAEVRLPRGADLIPPALGARLARSDAVRAERLPAERVAGRSAAGLRLLPTDPTGTTIERVDLWADPGTGLPLRVEVHARGGSGPALTSSLLDVQLGPPPATSTEFQPPADVQVQVVDAPDVAAASDRFAPFALPATLAGLSRRPRVNGLGQGVASYGDGFTAMTLVPLERGVANRLLEQLAPNGGDSAEIATALLQGLVGRAGRRAYLLAGTVPPSTLRRALAELVAAPPPFRQVAP